MSIAAFFKHGHMPTHINNTKHQKTWLQISSIAAFNKHNYSSIIVAAFLVNAAKKNTAIASIFCSVGRFILDIINHVSIYFTTSTTFNDLLCHCGLIDKSLSKLQGIVSHDDFGKLVQSFPNSFITL